MRPFWMKADDTEGLGKRRGAHSPGLQQKWHTHGRKDGSQYVLVMAVEESEVKGIYAERGHFLASLE